MSIMVKGIKMPKSCYSENEYCPFRFFAYEGGSHCSISECKCLKTARPKDCPLVEVPSDVRLTDADKLKDIIVRCIKDAEKEYPKEDFELVKMVYESCLYHIMNAPTV